MNNPVVPDPCVEQGDQSIIAAHPEADQPVSHDHTGD